jgi:hypothetical protein
MRRRRRFRRKSEDRDRKVSASGLGLTRDEESLHGMHGNPGTTRRRIALVLIARLEFNIAASY